MPSFRVNFKKTTRLEDAEFSLSEKENEGAGRSFFVSILENEAGDENEPFSKERDITVLSTNQAAQLDKLTPAMGWLARSDWDELSSGGDD